MQRSQITATDSTGRTHVNAELRRCHVKRTPDRLHTCALQVVSVGPEVKLSLAPGDIVVYQKYAMAEVSYG